MAQVTGQLRAVLHHELDGPVRRPHERVRIDQLLLELTSGTDGADVAQVRRHARADAVDAVTRDASPLALEDRPPVHGVAAHDTRAPLRRRRGAAQERDDGAGLRLGKAARRHRRAGDPELDDEHDLGVAGRATEPSTLDLDAWDHVAVRSMASGAA